MDQTRNFLRTFPLLNLTLLRALWQISQGKCTKNESHICNHLMLICFMEIVFNWTKHRFIYFGGNLAKHEFGYRLLARWAISKCRCCFTSMKITSQIIIWFQIHLIFMMAILIPEKMGFILKGAQKTTSGNRFYKHDPYAWASIWSRPLFTNTD